LSKKKSQRNKLPQPKLQLHLQKLQHLQPKLKQHQKKKTTLIQGQKKKKKNQKNPKKN
jgi:hypothetical protein